MIYLFYGSDEARVRAKAFAWVAAARVKEPNLAYTRLAREELTSAGLEDATVSGGLFVSRTLILIDDPFPVRGVPSYERAANDEEEGGSETEQTVGTSLVEEYLDRLVASDNAIIILAPKLAAVRAKKLAAKAAKEYRFDLSAPREAGRGFNSALVNALAARSPDKLWLELNRALRVGDAPEMLHGVLHWKARDLMEKGSAKWSPRESRALSLSLILICIHKLA